MSAARFKSRELKAMWAIASTIGTIPGFSMMSMCSMVLPRYLPLSASSLALRGLVFNVLSAMIAAPSLSWRGWKIEKATSAHYDVSRPQGDATTAIAGRGGFGTKRIYAQWYGDVKHQ